MTYMDQFSKIIQLVPLHESDAHTMAEEFLIIVVSQYSLPECIMSNHDPHFVGHFWEELRSLLDITLKFSIASHTQTGGIAEVMNQTME